MSARKEANKKLKEDKQLNLDIITELLTLLNVYIARWFLTLEFFNILALKPNSCVKFYAQFPGSLCKLFQS